VVRNGVQLAVVANVEQLRRAALGTADRRVALDRQEHSAPDAAHADQPPGPQSIIVGGGGQPTITTNKFFYTAGEWAQICYHVPGPGYVQITDQQGYSVKTLVAGYDNGAGDCFWGTVTPPFGQECLRIVYWFPYGGSSSNQTCFQVFPSYPFPY